jgi:hypothetical protein
MFQKPRLMLEGKGRLFNPETGRVSENHILLGLMENLHMQAF